MFSNELARKLINLPKEIDGINTINLSDEKTRFTLVNNQEPDYLFILEITSNKKITFKISLHHQEDITKEGLIRIDYKGGHKNPESLNQFVPEIVKPYVGYWFQNEPHIHVYVEGYRDLAWAIPLAKYNFPILSINDSADFMNAIYAFAKEINIVTPISIQTAII